MSQEKRWKIFFFLIFLGNFISGIWMLVGPTHWYENFPGRIPDFGPLNEHFVRDLGCIFLVLSIISFKSVVDSSWRKNTLFILQLWFTAHAIVHLFDTLRGLVAMEHLYMDIPLCYMPPVLVGYMQFYYYKEQNSINGSKLA
ncbi:hypothetical protein ACRXCV_12145 [Halobacteriovorax sp. GFR7]|uniref:hypothetical protein n=1 Tax=unclassified Halobacteriovorax TaxID=2639665 RepID=UPI003D95C14E